MCPIVLTGAFSHPLGPAPNERNYLIVSNRSAMLTRDGLLRSDPFRRMRSHAFDLQSLPLPTLPQIAQVVAADAELPAHLFNSDGWLPEYACADRGHCWNHRLANEHPQLTLHHLTCARSATPFLPMGALKNRSLPLHTFKATSSQRNLC